MLWKHWRFEWKKDKSALRFWERETSLLSWRKRKFKRWRRNCTSELKKRKQEWKHFNKLRNSSELIWVGDEMVAGEGEGDERLERGAGEEEDGVAMVVAVAVAVEESEGEGEDKLVKKLLLKSSVEVWTERGPEDEEEGEGEWRWANVLWNWKRMPLNRFWISTLSFCLFLKVWHIENKSQRR
jgi:hypothetical protein